MGTIGLKSPSDDDGVLFMKLMAKLRDRPMSLTSKEKAERRSSNWLGGKSYTADQAGYLNHLHGYILTPEGEERYVSIFYGPKRFRYELPIYRLVWHQSQWKNQKEVVETFSHHLGMSKSYEIFYQWGVDRLDLPIDTGFSFDLLKRSIFKSKISSREIITSNLKTYYWGSPSSKSRLMAYEKSIEASLIDVGTTPFMKSGTRIELRLMRDRVPIKSYSEYSKMAELNLFDGVKNFFMNKEAWAELNESMTGLRLIKMLQFQKMVQKEGFSIAMKEMNKDHNFNRTIGKYISNHATTYDFSEIWKQKVLNRIIAGFDINAYFDVQTSSDENLDDPRPPKIRFFYDSGPSMLH